MADLPKGAIVTMAYIGEGEDSLSFAYEPGAEGLKPADLASEYDRIASAYERLARRYGRCSKYPWLSLPHPNSPVPPLLFGDVPADYRRKAEAIRPN